jgi:hypothetical protein
MKAGKRKRGLAAAAALAALVATALVFVPPAFEVPTKNSLHAYVIAGTKGPLVACHEDGSNCGTGADTAWFYIYVANANGITNRAGGTNRVTLPNSYVVDRVDWRIFVNGVDRFDDTFTPAPNPSIRSWSGHWPSTVTCATPAPDPCTNVRQPAVIPGENTAVLYAGWSHGDAEPDGTYVFEFTVHGSLNGEPVDLVARSKPIEMTS